MEPGAPRESRRRGRHRERTQGQQKLGDSIQRLPGSQRVHIVSPMHDLSVHNRDDRDELVVTGRTTGENPSVYLVITIGGACILRLAIDLPKSSSNRSTRQVQPNLEAQRWCSLRTKRTTERFRKGCWGKGLKCRPLPQTPSPARGCNNALRKAEAVSKKTVPL